MISKPPVAGTAKEDLRIMRILSLSMVVTVIIFAGFSLYLVNARVIEPALAEYRVMILWIVAGITAVAVYFATTRFSKEIRQARETDITLRDKLVHYRASLIKYFAFCEAPALFAVVMFMLTGEYILFAIGALALVAMIFKIPTPGKLKNELQLDWKEQEEL
jgi:hypothetical protein